MASSPIYSDGVSPSLGSPLLSLSSSLAQRSLSMHSLALCLKLMLLYLVSPLPLLRVWLSQELLSSQLSSLRARRCISHPRHSRCCSIRCSSSAVAAVAVMAAAAGGLLWRWLWRWRQSLRLLGA